MSNSVAHRHGLNLIGESLYPDGTVPWREATPPPATGVPRVGRLRACGYCGSMHPADVAAAIREEAKGEWADFKYGWPHKAYFDLVPNPHAGMMEVRSMANFKPDGYPNWVHDPDSGYWHEPPVPASTRTHGKFYSVHLQDATEEERKIIEDHLGLRFTFHENGGVSWSPTRLP